MDIANRIRTKERGNRAAIVIIDENVYDPSNTDKVIDAFWGHLGVTTK